MKGKTLLSLAIVLSMLAAAIPVVAVRAQPTTVEVIFENGTNESPEYHPCEYFTVEIWIYDTPDITQYIIELTWDDNLELATGTEADVHKGTFLGGEVFLVTIGLDGRLQEVTEAKLAGTTAGTGLLFSIDFHCVAPSEDLIHFVRAILLNGLNVVPCTPVDGILHQVAPPATPPEAIITEPIHCTTIWVGTSVSLDGRDSTDGYDTMGTLNPDGHACPITDWMWEIDFGNDGSIDLVLHGDYIVDAFVCSAPGDVGITLTVTAPDWDPPTAGSYIDHDSSPEVVIHQVIKPVGPAIDVITNKGPFPLGSTPNNNPIGVSDAFGPQEEICFYAKVTYNDAPVEYKPVGFEVINALGQRVDFRVAFTNASGIAVVCMRIPWEGSDAEDFFGWWATVASVDVAGTVVTDTVLWEFGYIISIIDVAVTGSPAHKGDTLTIDVDLKSISMVPHDVLLTIVAADECGVPIGLTADFITVDAYDGWSAGHTITIPSWAFVGTGKIYVNVFTDYPSYGGVPYCPEYTPYPIFIIVYP